MLTLCKQGVITLEIPGKLSDTSHRWWWAAPLSDYVRYGANVSRPPVPPSNPSSHESPDSSGPAGPEHPGRPARPVSAAVVAAIVAAEAIALLIAACWYGYELVSGAPVLSFWGAVFTLALLLAFAAWLAAVALFLLRGYRWTRAAALVAQLFVLTIGFPTVTGGLVFPGLAMILPAALAIVFLFDRRLISYASRTGGSPPAL